MNIELLNRKNIINLIKITTELKDSKYLLIEDSIIEEYVTELLEKESIKNIAVFGFKDKIRLITELESIINTEIIIEISFEKLIWEKEKRQFIFKYEILQISPVNSLVKTFEAVPSLITNLLIPFSGIITKQIIDFLAKKFSDHKIKQNLNLDAIVVKDNFVSIDIDLLLEKKVSQNSYLQIFKRSINFNFADLFNLFTVNEVKFSKKGIFLKISISNEIMQIIEKYIANKNEYKELLTEKSP